MMFLRRLVKARGHRARLMAALCAVLGLLFWHGAKSGEGGLTRCPVDHPFAYRPGTNWNRCCSSCMDG